MFFYICRDTVGWGGSWITPIGVFRYGTHIASFGGLMFSSTLWWLPNIRFYADANPQTYWSISLEWFDGYIDVGTGWIRSKPIWLEKTVKWDLRAITIGIKKFAIDIGNNPYAERGSVEALFAVLMLVVIVLIMGYLFVWPFVNVAINYSDIIAGIY
jgi:hypothetical protein